MDTLAQSLISSREDEISRNFKTEEHKLDLYKPDRIT